MDIEDLESELSSVKETLSEIKAGLSDEESMNLKIRAAMGESAKMWLDSVNVIASNLTGEDAGWDENLIAFQQLCSSLSNMFNTISSSIIMMSDKINLLENKLTVVDKRIDSIEFRVPVVCG